MSDVTPSAEECEVDPDLTRRVAWGMIAGKSKAEIAEAEGLTTEECEIVCTAPGMFSIMNVWVNFLERRKEGGRRNTRKLTGWCVEHVFQHAPERLNRNEVWRLDRLSSVMLYYGFAIVFGWMLGFLDGVMGIPGARRKDLGDFKQNLVDLLCWTVEVTFREKMLEQFSVELLIAKDGAFQAAIAGREYYELGIGAVSEGAEEVAGEKAASQIEPPVRRPGTYIGRRAWPLRASADRIGARSRPPSFVPRYARSAPIRPPPSRAALRWRDGRCSLPPLLRPRPSERAAMHRA